MPLSGSCADAKTAVIEWTRTGDVNYTSGVFPADQIDYQMGLIGREGRILYIVVMDSNGNVIQCCPDGYHYDPKQLACVPGPPPNPQPPQCPDGFVWDPSTETCVPVPPPPGPPLPPEPEPPEGGGGCCDDDFNQQLGQILYAIYRVLKELLAAELAEKPMPQDDCCNRLVAGLTAISTALDTIAKELTLPGPPGPTPPDLTPIVEALVSINTTLGEINGKPPLDLTPIVDALDRLTAQTKVSDDAIAKAITDLSLLPTSRSPIDQAWVDRVVSLGFLDDDFSAMIQAPLAKPVQGP